MFQDERTKEEQERRAKEQQQQILAAADADAQKVPPGSAGPGSTPPGLLVSPMQGASSMPTSTAVLANSKQPERMDDAQVFHFTAGGKRGETPSPARCCRASYRCKSRSTKEGA